MPTINAQKGTYSRMLIQTLLALVTILMAAFAAQANDGPTEIVAVNLNGSQKLVAQPIASAGDTLDYTIIINNDTDTTATAIQLNDTLPATMEYVIDSIDSSEGVGIISDSGYPKYLNGAILWQGTLAARQQIKISFSAKLDTTVAANVPVTNTAIINQASQTYTKSAVTMITQNGGNELPASNIVPSLEEARAGQRIRYVISVKNEDPINTATFSVTDTLPTSLSYVNNSFSTDSVPGDAITNSGGHSNGVISWTGLIKGGKEIKIGFDAILATDLPVDRVVKNYALIQNVTSGKSAVKMASTTIVAKNSTMAYLPIIINNWPSTPLAAPVLKNNTISSVKYDMSWTAVSGASSYILEQSTSADFSNFSVIYSGNGLSHHVSNPNYILYYYRARAVGIDANYGAYLSPYSNVEKSISSQFYADAITVGNGCTTLRWNFENIKTISIVFIHGMDPQPTVGIGTREICPSIDTTYKAVVVDKNNVKTEYNFAIDFTGSGCNKDPYVTRFEPSALTVPVNTNVTIYWDVSCAGKLYVQAENGDRNPAVGTGQRSWPVYTATRKFWLSVVAKDAPYREYVSTLIISSSK